MLFKRKIRLFDSLPIKYKFLIVCYLVVVIVGLLGSGYVYFSVKKTIENSVMSELERSVTSILGMVRAAADVSIRSHLKGIAEKNKEIVTYIYKQSQEGLLSEVEAKGIARELMLSQQIGKTGYLYAIDSKGNVIMHPREGVEGSDVLGFDFIQEQLKRKEGYLEYNWKNPDEEEARAKALYMTYFEPWDLIISASSYRSEFKNFVDVDILADNILPIKFGETGYPYIINSKGDVVVHPNITGNSYDVTDSKGRYFLREICAKKDGMLFYDWKNPAENKYREKIAIFRYMPEYDWIVAASSYKDEFHKPLIKIKNIFIFTLFVTFLVLFFLILYVSSLITSPLRQLMKKFDQAVDGDLSVRMDNVSKDEVGKLAHGFNAFMESLEKARQAVENASKAKSRFLANVSHEIRTPLNCIMGFIEVILRSDIKDEVRENSEKVLHESENLLMLINDLLDHSKIESGRLELEAEPFDLNKMVEEVFQIMSNYASKKKISYDMIIEKNVPRCVEGDSFRLRQIVVNLLSNAIKFTEEGSVVLRIKLVSSRGGVAKIMFSVVDTGIGISKEKQDIIFQDFKQAEDSTTRRYGGTGLGTTISKQLVELMGGEIGVDSQAGLGSTFWFVLSMKECSEEVASKFLDDGSSKSFDLKRKCKTIHVLLVEDYVLNQEVVKAHLESAGYTFELAENGKVALQMCHDKIFDLIIMDVQMPEMDGYETTMAIREINEDYRKVPIIAMTANADLDTRRKCKQAGMNDFISKPLRYKSFIGMLNKYTLEENGEDSQIEEKESFRDPMSFEEALCILDGDRILLESITNRFLKSLPNDLIYIRDLMETQDYKGICRLAHKIKGTSSSIAAYKIFDISSRIEESACSGEHGELRHLIDELEVEYNNLKIFLLK